MTESEASYNPNTHAALQEDFHKAVVLVGDQLNCWGDALSGHATIRFTDDDKYFQPMPSLKLLDGGVEVTCNPASIELWHDALIGTPDLTGQDIQDIYFANAASMIELTFLSLAAKQERKFEDVPGMTSKILGRVATTASRFHDKEQIELMAIELEEVHGQIGARSMAERLSMQDVITINQLRYGIGTALYAMDMGAQKAKDIQDSFRNSLLLEVSKYEAAVFGFLEVFTNPTAYARLESHLDQIRASAYAQLLVAGSSPMGY